MLKPALSYERVGLAEPGEPADGGLPATGFRIDRRLPVSEQVYDALRNAILDLSFQPRSSISENALCREFGVSRTPVRAAIQRLVEEDLVEVYPNLGSFVSPLKLSRMQDNHFVRVSIEIALLREVGAHWSPETSEPVRLSLLAQRRLAETDAIDAFFEEDMRFHRLFAVVAGRPGVWPSVSAAWVRMLRFLRIFGSSKRLPQVIEEHQAVVDALDRGDVEAAVAALVFHVDRNFGLIDDLPVELRGYFDP